MSDLIDRDETIKQFCKQDCGCDPKDCPDKTCYEVEIIESVPTHPTPSNTLGALDCVERAEVIKAVKFYETFCDPYPRVIEALEELPSVQPDKDLIHLQKEQAYMQGYEDGRKVQEKIVYCGECKYMMPNGRCSQFADSTIRPSASDFCSAGELRGEQDDLISRQTAIDAVETKIKKWNAVDGEGYHVGLGLRYTDVIDTLTELPSVQPEIIRCKDCKHWHNSHTSDGYNSCEKDALIRHESFFCASGKLRGDSE